MKNLFLAVIMLLLVGCNSSNSNYENEIKKFQYDLNTHYADKESSPLTEEDLLTFKTLDFFEINEDYRVVAHLELTPNAPVFEMKTTTERLPLYKKYGIAHFELNGNQLELSVYQNQDLKNSLEYANYLFLPYNDATNGNSSYEGGRFIDLEIPKDTNNTIIIDFNKSYNPYCAYNHKYSCPIPPAENILPIAIPVGVKAYDKHH
jgi:uncharacterized protein (DUF1684 family)